MVQAVLFVLVMVALVGWPSSLYLLRLVRRRPLTTLQEVLMVLSFASAGVLSLTTWLLSMRAGVRALQKMGD